MPTVEDSRELAAKALALRARAARVMRSADYRSTAEMREAQKLFESALQIERQMQRLRMTRSKRR